MENYQNREARAAMTTVFQSQLLGSMESANAEKLLNNIKDYSKCPHCGSTDLKEMTKEEFEQHKTQQDNSKSETVSAADELKKFKELLDMGVITQEEFDAKKKQLLGI